MSGTNRFLISDNALENESQEDLAEDLIDANAETIKEYGTYGKADTK